MSLERWKTRIGRTVGAALIAGTMSGIAETPRPVYSSANEQSTETATVPQITAEVAKILQTKDISTLTKLIDPTNIAWSSFRGSDVLQIRTRDWQPDELFGMWRQAVSSGPICIGYVEVGGSKGQSYSILFRNFNSTLDKPRFASVGVATDLYAEEYRGYSTSDPLRIRRPGYKGWKIAHVNEYSEEEFKLYFTERDLNRYIPCGPITNQPEAKPGVGQGEALSAPIEAKSDKDLVGTITNVTLAFQKKDLNSLKKYVRPSEFATFEESYNKISAQYKVGEEGFDCYVYRLVGTRPLHPGLSRGDIRLFVRWFYLPGIATGHSNIGGGSVYFARDSSYPLGWRLKLVAEDPPNSDQDLSGEGDFLPCPYPLVETPVGQGEALSTPIESGPASTEARRFIVYQTGLTTPVDNSGSAAGKIEMFEPLQNKLHKGHDLANIINASRGWSFNEKGEYVAGIIDCEQSLLHPYEVGVNLANIIIELLLRNPESYVISIDHSAGGNAAMQAIQHIRVLVKKGDLPEAIVKRISFITAHSPIQGVSRNWIAEIRKFGVWHCEIGGMPNTESPAYTYLRQLWNNKVKTRTDIKGDVTWFRENGGGAYGLVNVPDKVIAPSKAIWAIPLLKFQDFTFGLAEEILTQEIPGGQNFRFYLQDSFLNHTALLTTEEGKNFIAKLVGEEVKS